MSFEHERKTRDFDVSGFPVYEAIGACLAMSN